MVAVVLSWAVTGLGVLVFAVTALRGAAHPPTEARTVAAATGLALDFFLAAGLLRLSRQSSFGVLATVAAIVALRKLLTAGVRYAVRAAEA